MKVAIPVSLGLPSDGGGYTIQYEIIQKIIELLPETNHEIWIFNLSDSSVFSSNSCGNYKDINFKQFTLNTFLSFLRLNIIRLINKIKQFNTIFLVISLKEAYFHDFIQQNHFDFAWLLSPFFPVNSLPYSRPFAITVWDLQHRLQPYFPEVSSGKEWYTRENLYQKKLKRASYIITGTERGRSEVTEFYNIPQERVQILPFPIPDFISRYSSTHDKSLFLKKYNLPLNYFFYPAQFWSHKNHFGLLKAFQILRKQHNVLVSLVLTGSDQGNKSYINKIIRDLEIEEYVYDLGFVSQPDLVNLYKFAISLVFLTYFGPDNLPPLEAFALGCPVIASNIPGAKEQFEDAAILVDPGNFNEIALAMKMIFEDADVRERYIAKGLKKVSSMTTTHYVNRVFSLLDEFENIRFCWQNSSIP